jgi:GNAT superfamily N-acetyltransferase
MFETRGPIPNRVVPTGDASLSANEMSSVEQPFHVRDATVEDWPVVARLLAELGRPEVLGSEDEPAARSIFQRYLERGDAVALVAEDDHGVVGFCDVEFRVRLNFTTPQAWIADLIVSERDRSRGVGRMLLARAEALARARDCWSMTLESANWRIRAHDFYLREGWSDFARGFARNLSDYRWPAPEPGVRTRSPKAVRTEVRTRGSRTDRQRGG